MTYFSINIKNFVILKTKRVSLGVLVYSYIKIFIFHLCPCGSNATDPSKNVFIYLWVNFAALVIHPGHIPIHTLSYRHTKCSQKDLEKKTRMIYDKTCSPKYAVHVAGVTDLKTGLCIRVCQLIFAWSL